MTTETKTYSFPFTNRETYLAWRAEWKANITKLVAAHKGIKRSGGYGYRDEITEAIAERRASKVEAHRQYTAAKKLKEAA